MMYELHNQNTAIIFFFFVVILRLSFPFITVFAPFESLCDTMSPSFSLCPVDVLFIAFYMDLNVHSMYVWLTSKEKFIFF